MIGSLAGTVRIVYNKSSSSVTLNKVYLLLVYVETSL